MLTTSQRENIHTVKDALLNISSPQSVTLTSSTRPGVSIEASQQVLIEALPPVLVLHLKRFLYDTSVGGVVKLGKQVTFGGELEIPVGQCFQPFFFPLRPAVSLSSDRSTAIQT